MMMAHAAANGSHTDKAAENGRQMGKAFDIDQTLSH